MGATMIAQLLRSQYGMNIDNNYVHRILLLRGLAMEDPKKKKRRKPWVRYERHHSLSAVHMDWTQLTSSGIWTCAVLDDASRMILAMIETPHATAQASVALLDEARRAYEHIGPIQSVIVDHGVQFYANKRDKNGNANHMFEQYCESKNIKLILCKYHHPQSNGKIERFFQTYKKYRFDFASLDEFVYWYNSVRPHMSLDLDHMETPEKAFYRKAQDIILGNFMRLIENENKEEVL